MAFRARTLVAPLRRDPDLPRIALLAAVGGSVAGFFGFAIGSSRGLDLIEVEDTLGAATLLLLGASVVFGLARVAMAQDWRALAVAVALVVCLPLGYHLSNMTLPGNTTDGTVLIDVPALPPFESLPTSAHGKCTWRQDRTAVVAADSRRESVRFPGTGQPRMMAHVEVGAEGRGTLRILVVPPLGGEPVYRYTGTGEVSFAEPTGRVGRIAVSGVVRERVGMAPIDPDVAALLESTAPPTTGASVAWNCPAWP